jgi:predicted S18 family serine protease
MKGFDIFRQINDKSEDKGAEQMNEKITESLIKLSEGLANQQLNPVQAVQALNGLIERIKNLEAVLENAKTRDSNNNGGQYINTSFNAAETVMRPQV